MEFKELEKTKLEFHYLGYYLRWIPQENYYYSVKHADFQARPYRTQGTYTKYISLDDKIEDLNYYTTYIKFGIGRNIGLNARSKKWTYKQRRGTCF